MSGVTENDGSLFVGRVGGSIPCYVTINDGKIDSFVYGFEKTDSFGRFQTSGDKRVFNGEVMVLTN